MKERIRIWRKTRRRNIDKSWLPRDKPRGYGGNLVTIDLPSITSVYIITVLLDFNGLLKFLIRVLILIG